MTADNDHGSGTKYVPSSSLMQGWVHRDTGVRGGKRWRVVDAVTDEQHPPARTFQIADRADLVLRQQAGPGVEDADFGGQGGCGGRIVASQQHGRGAGECGQRAPRCRRHPPAAGRSGPARRRRHRRRRRSRRSMIIGVVVVAVLAIGGDCADQCGPDRRAAWRHRHRISRRRPDGSLGNGRRRAG
jgi:hypothetical protein